MSHAPLPDAALDQLFRTARTRNAWVDETLPDSTIRALYDLAALGPTSANNSPARYVFVTSAEGKAKLGPLMSEGNQKAMAAPCIAIIGYDLDFPRYMERLFPHNLTAKHWFGPDKDCAAAPGRRLPQRLPAGRLPDPGRARAGAGLRPDVGLRRRGRDARVLRRHGHPRRTSCAPSATAPTRPSPAPPAWPSTRPRGSPDASCDHARDRHLAGRRAGGRLRRRAVRGPAQRAHGARPPGAARPPRGGGAGGGRGAPADIGKVAVTVGPGSFTGLRVGLAFAKAFALARGVPCVGVGTLEALAAAFPAGEVAAVIAAPHDRAYLQRFSHGAALVRTAPPAARRPPARPRGRAARWAPAPRCSAARSRTPWAGPTSPPSPALGATATAAPDPIYLREVGALTIAERRAAAGGEARGRRPGGRAPPWRRSTPRPSNAPGTAAAFADLLAAPGVFALAVGDDGFILVRARARRGGGADPRGASRRPPPRPRPARWSRPRPPWRRRPGRRRCGWRLRRTTPRRSPSTPAAGSRRPGGGAATTPGPTARAADALVLRLDLNAPA